MITFYLRLVTKWLQCSREFISYGSEGWEFESLRVHHSLSSKTGSRRQFTQPLIPDLSGVRSVTNFRVTPDENAYAYSYERNLSTLYVLDGLKWLKLCVHIDFSVNCHWPGLMSNLILSSAYMPMRTSKQKSAKSASSFTFSFQNCSSSVRLILRGPIRQKFEQMIQLFVRGGFYRSIC